MVFKAIFNNILVKLFNIKANHVMVQILHNKKVCNYSLFLSGF